MSDNFKIQDENVNSRLSTKQIVNYLGWIFALIFFILWFSAMNDDSGRASLDGDLPQDQLRQISIEQEASTELADEWLTIARGEGLSAEERYSAYFEAGSVYAALENWQLAIDAYRSAEDLDTGATATYQATADAYYALGNKSEALKYYRLALDILGDNPESLLSVDRFEEIKDRVAELEGS